MKNNTKEHQMNNLIEYIDDLNNNIKAIKQTLGDRFSVECLRNNLKNIKEQIKKIKQDEATLPEIAKMYQKLDHAIYHAEEALSKKQESSAIIAKLFVDIHYMSLYKKKGSPEPMVFEKNKEELLKNNELNVHKAKEIKTKELSEFCDAIEQYDKIITEKDENKQAVMIRDFLSASFEKNNDETLNPEMLKLWRKLYHALCYRCDAMEKIEESTEVISQMIEDWKQIMKAKA